MQLISNIGISKKTKENVGSSYYIILLVKIEKSMGNGSIRETKEWVKLEYHESLVDVLGSSGFSNHFLVSLWLWHKHKKSYWRVNEETQKTRDLWDPRDEAALRYHETCVSGVGRRLDSGKLAMKWNKNKKVTRGFVSLVSKSIQPKSLGPVPVSMCFIFYF